MFQHGDHVLVECHELKGTVHKNGVVVQVLLGGYYKVVVFDEDNDFYYPTKERLRFNKEYYALHPDPEVEVRMYLNENL